MNWILVYSYLSRTVKERIVRSMKVDLLFPSKGLEVVSVASELEVISKIRRT